MPAVKNKNKRKKGNRNLTAALLIGGAVLVLMGLVKQIAYNRALAPLAVKEGKEQVGMADLVPKRMMIGDKINISLDEAALIGNKWTVSPVNGTYLINSARLGEVGNMIIYGHNRKQILGNLRQLKGGDRIVLYDAAGKTWPYRVVKTLTINPAEAFWLQNTDTPMLTVYTCTGLLDSKRLIVRAVPVKGD